MALRQLYGIDGRVSNALIAWPRACIITEMGVSRTRHTRKELSEALRAIDSIIGKCEKALGKFSEGVSQFTLLRNRLAALRISKELIERELTEESENGTD